MTKSLKDKKYDLEERTAKFAEAAIEIVRKLPQDAVNKRIITQLVASSGSIGANYCEATEAESKKDFVHKIKIAKKEIKETRLWIRLLAKANANSRDDLRDLWQEAQELLFIFAKIIRTAEEKK